MHDIAALADYKMVAERLVAWGDMDAMRHVNNTKYFFYCETARLDFLKELFPNQFMSQSAPGQTGIALAETGCRFKVSLTYPDDLSIGTGVSQIDETQFELKHAIYSKKLDLIAAEASARMVHFDFSAGKRAALTQDMHKILNQYAVPSA